MGRGNDDATDDTSTWGNVREGARTLVLTCSKGL